MNRLFPIEGPKRVHMKIGHHVAVFEVYVSSGVFSLTIELHFLH